MVHSMVDTAWWTQHGGHSKVHSMVDRAWWTQHGPQRGGHSMVDTVWSTAWWTQHCPQRGGHSIVDTAWPTAWWTQHGPQPGGHSIVDMAWSTAWWTQHGPQPGPQHGGLGAEMGRHSPVHAIYALVRRPPWAWTDINNSPFIIVFHFLTIASRGLRRVLPPNSGLNPYRRTNLPGVAAEVDVCSGRSLASNTTNTCSQGTGFCSTRISVLVLAQGCVCRVISRRNPLDHQVVIPVYLNFKLLNTQQFYSTRMKSGTFFRRSRMSNN
jgi:hypothetical protein